MEQPTEKHPSIAPGKISDLKNNYLCMRHGRSLANAEGLIISDPATGINGWGLAQDAELDLRRNLAQITKDPGMIVLTSPFRRARETAGLAVEFLGCKEEVIEPDLRERYFGEMDGKSDTNYPLVWSDDLNNPDNTRYGVESPRAVLDRILGLIVKIESQWSEQTLILVSHGDPLDILLAWSVGKTPDDHMNTGMQTGEIRPLNP